MSVLNVVAKPDFIKLLIAKSDSKSNSNACSNRFHLHIPVFGTSFSEFAIDSKSMVLWCNELHGNLIAHLSYRHMALTQICDRKKKLLLTTLKGDITGQQIMEAYSRIYMQPAFDESFHQLWDCRLVKTLSLEMEDVSGLVQLADTFCPKEGTKPGRMVIVATNQEVINLAKMLMESTGPRLREKNLVPTMQEGLKWLGIEVMPAYMLN